MRRALPPSPPGHRVLCAVAPDMEADVAHLVAALSKIRSPMLRYLLTMIVDLLADRLSELDPVASPDHGEATSPARHAE